MELLNKYPQHTFSENALTVFKKRYFQHHETTPTEVFQRVANALADVEKDYNTAKEDMELFRNNLYNIMAKGLALPAGRTLANAGTNNRLISNCIVLHIEDSMESIFGTLKDAALLQKAGSGLGFPFHKLRPAGSDTKQSKGIASGPVSFLRLYDSAFSVVKQHARHGANMCVMSVEHPDILEFIDCKQKEGDIRNFNVSVALTDKFLSAAIDNDPTPWMCNWNGTPMLPREISRDPYAGITTVPVELTPQQLLTKIATSSWRNGEPGFIFIDTVNKTNPVPGLGRIEASNPCLVADSWITTSEGPRQIKELIDTPYKLPAMSNPHIIVDAKAGFFSKGVKPVFLLKTVEGYEVTLTDNHRVLVEDGWKEAKQLVKGDKIWIDQSHPLEWKGDGTEDEGYIVGLIMGDGYLKDDSGVVCMWDTNESVETMKREVDRIVTKYLDRDLTWTRIEDRHEYRMTCKWFAELCNRFGLVKGNKHLNPLIEKASSAFYCGFLRGFFDCDGSPQGFSTKGGFTIRLSQSNKPDLQVIQRMLLRLGIHSKLYKRKEAEEKLMPNGKGGQKLYMCKSLYEVIITGFGTVNYFKRIGFIREHKAKKVRDAITQRTASYRIESPYLRFDSLEDAGQEVVYTTTVNDEDHAYGAQGMIHANCGEQFLHDGDVCNLGAINLAPFSNVRSYEALTWKEYIDWDALRLTTQTMVRALDNVIDRTDHPVDRVNTTFRANRRIGLGIMGFSGMLYRLRIPYNTDLGREVAATVMSFINNEAANTSELLASVKGSFPNLNISIYASKPRRNAALTNIAPTGTTSMALDTGSGLEPEFALAYYKKVMGGLQLRYVNKELLTALEEAKCADDDTITQILTTGTIQKCSNIPNWIKTTFVTSMDISAEDHVAMQATFQQHLNNASSKTINAPNSATVEDVRNIIVSAWKSGCKGCTIYRDGSRFEQVLNLNSSTSTTTTPATSTSPSPVTSRNSSSDSINTASSTSNNYINSCPDCSSTLIMSEGCIKCTSCGYGKCSV